MTHPRNSVAFVVSIRILIIVKKKRDLKYTRTNTFFPRNKFVVMNGKENDVCFNVVNELHWNQSYLAIIPKECRYSVIE